MTITARLTILLLLLLALLAGSAIAGESLSYSERAHQLMKSGDYDKALDELRRGVSLFPYDAPLRNDLASAYVDLAQRYLKASRYTEAADYFAQAHELYPDYKQFGVMRGISLYLAKNYDSARAELESEGDDLESLLYLGKISYDTGDLPGAVAFWRRGLEKDPQNKALLSLVEKAERELPVESKMDKGYSSMFDLSFDDQLPPGLSEEVLDALESAYNAVGVDLGVFPPNRIPVLLYTRSDYSSVTAGPDWSGGLYDGKIRLPVGGVTTLTKQLRAIIFHEYTHVVIAEMTGGNVPTWLNEGLAEIEGRKEFNHPHADLTRASQQGQLVPLSTLSGSFAEMSGGEASVAYEESYSIANFIVSRYGWYPIQTILKSLGERATFETAVSKALRDYSLDLPGVMREWQSSL